MTGPNVEADAESTHNHTFHPTTPIDCDDFSTVHGNDPIRTADRVMYSTACNASTLGSGAAAGSPDAAQK